MTNEPLRVFWSYGDRRGDAHRYGIEMEASHRGSSSELYSVMYFAIGNVTLLGAHGEQWREYLIRKPGWVEAVEGAPVPQTSLTEPGSGKASDER